MRKSEIDIKGITNFGSERFEPKRIKHPYFISINLLIEEDEIRSMYNRKER